VFILKIKVCVEKSVCMYSEVYVLMYEKGVYGMYKVRGILCGRVCESKSMSV
jgi:hypothetical protein